MCVCVLSQPAVLLILIITAHYIVSVNTAKGNDASHGRKGKIARATYRKQKLKIGMVIIINLMVPVNYDSFPLSNCEIIFLRLYL